MQVARRAIGRDHKVIILPIITCDHCCACCEHIAGPPYTQDELLEMREQQPDAYTALYPDLMAAIDRRDMHVAMGDADLIPCGFLDKDGKCSHYEHRPAICRDFERGGYCCQQAVIGRAKIVSSEPFSNMRKK
jgi:Fe-S-cluster containining protein